MAIPGEHVDGHDFVAGAAAAGAVAAIVERPLPDVGLAQLVVGRSTRALASAAAWWYGDSSHELAVVGITGTDGKTTTSFLAVAALEAAGVPTGLIGTIDAKVGAVREPNAEHVTTPGAPELQALLRAMVASGNEGAVVETTSHGLALERVAEVAYDAAILTNLTHEHLELHGTFEAYRAAKLSLFERLAAPATGSARPRVGIVNRDDPSADLFEAVVRESAPGSSRTARTRRRPSTRPASWRTRAASGCATRPPAAKRTWSSAWPAASTSTTHSRSSPSVRPGSSIRQPCGGPGIDARRARAHGAGRGGPAVRGHRRLRPHPRLTRRRAGPPRPAGGGSEAGVWA